MIMKKEIKPMDVSAEMIRWGYRWLLMTGLFFLGQWPIYAQDSTATQTEATEEAPPAEEEETTVKTRMSLTGDQYPDGTIVLHALLRAKVGSSYQKVPDRKIEFFALNAEGEEVALGHANTELNGIAAYTADKKNLFLGEDGSYSLLARWAGDERLEDSEGDLMLRPAALTMELAEADSTYTVKLQASAMTTDSAAPIAAAAVTVYVKRMFSSLKVAEGETDESGMVEVEFPAGLYGDDQGNLEITAMIEETEEYGNLVAKATQKWGIPVSKEAVETPRALWSPHPPSWMVITFFILMGAVWIHYVIVVINLFKIKSHRPQPEGKA